MSNRDNDRIQSLKNIYEEFHSRMKNIIKKQSDLIEKIARFSDSIKIDEIRERIKNL